MSVLFIFQVIDKNLLGLYDNFAGMSVSWG